MKLYKEGYYWKACYDQQRKKYYGYLMYTDREGQTRFLYEITKEIFDGTMGPERHVLDGSYTESDFDKAFEELKKKR